MLKGIQWFIERLVERLVPIIATSFSSTVETMHALGQAEQQSQLEDAAREYEADGKTEVAAALRQRASRLTSDNPAGEAIPIIENLAADRERLQRLGIEQRSNGDRPALPHFTEPKPKKNRRKLSTPKPPFDQFPEQTS